MATNTTMLNTKIRLRYDTLNHWTDLTKEGKGGNLVLLKGEVAFCEIPASSTVNGVTTNNMPTVIFKVGDGEHAFKDLNWGSATAADVYAWAKAAEKPSYNASEIALLDSDNHTTTSTVEAAIAEIYTTLAELTGEGSGSIEDQIIAITGTPDEGYTIQQEVDAVEQAITNLETRVGTPDNGKSIQDEIDDVEADIATLKGADTVAGSVAKAVKDEADRINAIVGTPDQGKTIQAEIDAVEADVATLNGDINTTGSVAKSINDAITGLNLGTTYAGKAYETKVDTLIGNVSGDDGKSARTMAAEEVAKIVAGADTSYDTLKEIADWIQSDTTGAAKMANDITALKTKTELGTYDNNGTPTEYATVKAYVEAVTGGLDTDLTTLEGRIDTAENDIDNLQTDVATLKGDNTTAGSVAKAVKDEADRINAIVGSPDQGKTIQDEIDDVEGAIATLNGTDTTAGSVAKAVKDAVDAIDYTVAANGTNETNKVLTGFEIENGGLKANSVTTTTLANIATTGNVADLIYDELILNGGDAGVTA